MLLAIADFADDDGNAYPSVGTLADKCRMGARNVNHILAALRASGELEVRLNEGPRGTNRYRILLGHPLKAASPLKPASPLKHRSSPPEGDFPAPLKPASDEPSMNHQEPSLPAGFEAFWAIYPNKAGKKPAVRAFRAARFSKELLATVMEDVRSRSRSELWTKSGGRFVPHAATYINQERWTDPLGPVAAPAEEHGWWATRSGILAKGRALEVRDPKDQSASEWLQYVARVWVAAGHDGPHWDDRSAAYPLAVRLRDGELPSAVQAAMSGLSLGNRDVRIDGAAS